MSKNIAPSLAEIEAEEREREETERKAKEDADKAAQEEQEKREASLRASITSDVQEERENMMAFAAVLLLLSAGEVAVDGGSSMIGP